ncbi:MAG: hypothetical protein HY362_04485 [Candidatus Aenigmarchaeota archaeon]|nr:hypothetical protein [Candidatus Aenigmarchaeota archaeon]
MPSLVTTTCALGDATPRVFETARGVLGNIFDKITVLGDYRGIPQVADYFRSIGVDTRQLNRGETPVHVAFQTAGKYDGKTLHAKYICRVLNWARRDAAGLKRLAGNEEAVPIIIERGQIPDGIYPALRTIGEAKMSRTIASEALSVLPNNGYLKEQKDFFGHALYAYPEIYEVLAANTTPSNGREDPDSFVCGEALGLLLLSSPHPSFARAEHLLPDPELHDVKGDRGQMLNEFASILSGFRSVLNIEKVGQSS